MHKRFVVNIVSRLVIFVSLMMLIPLAWAYDGGNQCHEAEAFLLTIGIGLFFGMTCLFLFPIQGGEEFQRMNAKDGLAIVGMSWITLSFLGALPLFFSGVTHHSFTDAFFEITSGFTTTGSTIFSNVEILPKGILFWRSFTHWLGGMGIIVLYIALLPALGAHAFQLYKAEAPGISVERADPRIKETAKFLWGIYFFFTFLETVLLMAGGMPLFDALCHTFGTLATGGFSTKNASIAAYGPYIQWVIIVFMILSGMNFILHYQLLIRRKPKALYFDEELRWYLGIMFTAVLFVVIGLEETHAHGHIVRDATFQVVSIMTTTGFTTANFDAWPHAVRFGFVLLMFIGACGGSTSGGMKLIRWLVSWKIAFASTIKSIFPNAIVPVKVNGKPLEDKMVAAVMAFFSIFMFLFFTGTALFIFFAPCDIVTGLSAVITVLSNIGPGLGKVGATQTYEWVSVPGKWVLIFLMLAGRLELYSILVLFVPATWKK